MVKIKVKDESKHEKFIRIATGRTQKVLDYLRILGNCANTQMEEVRHKFAIKINEKKLFKLH